MRRKSRIQSLIWNVFWTESVIGSYANSNCRGFLSFKIWIGRIFLVDRAGVKGSHQGAAAAVPCKPGIIRDSFRKWLKVAYRPGEGGCIWNGDDDNRLSLFLPLFLTRGSVQFSQPHFSGLNSHWHEPSWKGKETTRRSEHEWVVLRYALPGHRWL